MTVSVDTSALGPGVAVERFRAAGLPDWVQVHEYCEADMVRAYPVLTEELKKKPAMQKVRQLREGVYSLAWGFHGCALNIWFQSIPGESRPAFCWVFEDDVGFTGDLADFFAATHHETADLLADTIKPVSQTWFWWDTVSDEYDARVPLQDRWEAREHVQRFSRSLLDGLHQLAAEHRCAAWSEQSTPSLCQHLDLEMAQIDPVFISRPRFSWDTRLEESDWLALVSARSPRFRNKLYHALKF
ncbi:Hypothetical Protein FCC1311_032002 [Hondaea fermentalgiana]|uniref:Uncharacterized protein n=1 Tax=Hondaea fermentalgiana TaxID=2315210 RepID=A0A2R5G7F7_9STRA|nr:Hypothetical Protein FCC1311_032002 [Hondaea fermentalgiana]|eukprot:GBG26977.1 Hypothetical Protein FCC1311_032002 [Hondaea fermentalgiana]